MMMRFLSSSLCVIAVFVGASLPAAEWLNDEVRPINWQEIRLKKKDSGDRLRKKVFFREKKYSREELCDIACACVINILQRPQSYEQQVAGHSFTYKDLLSAVRISLNDKAPSKSDELRPVTVLVQDFSAVMSNPDNHQYIRSWVLGNVSNRRTVLHVLQKYIEDVKRVAPVTIIDPYTCTLGPDEEKQGPPFGKVPLLPPLPRLNVPLAVQHKHLSTNLPSLGDQQYPSACASCSQQVASSVSQVPTQSPRAQKQVGPYAAATVLGIALTGLLIDCAVRKQRSWLVRATQATGRAFRSLWRWLKMPGRQPGVE
jgi:hypothetical protein